MVDKRKRKSDKDLFTELANEAKETRQVDRLAEVVAKALFVLAGEDANEYEGLVTETGDAGRISQSPDVLKVPLAGTATTETVEDRRE